MPLIDNAALDGNSIGALLIDVFGTEMTDRLGTCASCGARSQVAEFVVYSRGPGTIARCRSCAALLMAFVTVRNVTCVDLSGLADLAV
jgi:hypothetical protein